MDLKTWTKRWIIAAMVCMVIITACGGYLLMGLLRSENPGETAAINQARLTVSDLMVYLEKNHEQLSRDESVRESLRDLSTQRGVSLLFAGLDGSVIFNSSQSGSPTRINPKTSVHFDLSAARSGHGTYKIAFPVVDPDRQTQVGNAIFELQADEALLTKRVSHAILPGVIMLLAFIVLSVLLFVLHRKINQGMISPVTKLKDYSEAILRGDYGQKVEYNQADEVGEMYAVFDQMRLEIMDLHRRRDEGEQSRKELISNISHDLKTPLATVKAYIEAIRDGVSPDMETVREYADVMHTQSDKMAKLIDDLLLHALRELGQISIQLTEQYSRRMFEEILQPARHLVETRGITYIGPAMIPDVLISADARRMEQVISNLIVNALKATPAGGRISISIELEPGQLRVSVTDTGSGIRPQDMPFIFERYYQGKSGQEGGHYSRTEGAGLGLSICKTIVEAHGGMLSFRSNKGQGTEFHFTLPVD